MFRSTLALAGLAALLASCGGGTDKNTIDLLKAGDAKVCIAADVEQSLRKLVLPKDGKTDGYTISFSDATLETFDKVVSKAACHANIKIDGPTEEIVGKTGFDFTVVPSAQDPQAFVIDAAMSGFAEKLATAIDSEMTAKDEARVEEAEEQRLAATVKDGWLIGRWVGAQQGSDACQSGFAEFARGHRYIDATGPAGTWKLTGTQLKIIGTGAAVTFNISEADQDTFSSDGTGTSLGSARRCSRAESAPPPEDDADADEPGDTSGIDAENVPSPPQ